jgi:exodeoxyribonuclease-3
MKSSGYHVFFRGMKAYNGVAILTRKEPEFVAFGFDDGGADADDARIMRVSVGGIPVINTYVPNGFKVGSPKHEYKLQWYARLQRYFTQHFSPEMPVVWCGDMNVAPEPIDVHSPEKHLNHVCYHSSVRDAYRKTRDWGFTDVFRLLYPERQQFTFWDYLRPSSLDNNKGWRIDHILATRTLAERCTESDVDVGPRRAIRASDHTVVWAEFDL